MTKIHIKFTKNTWRQRQKDEASLSYTANFAANLLESLSQNNKQQNKIKQVI